MATFVRARLQMGGMLATALMILIASDVFESLTKDAEHFSWDAIGMPTASTMSAC